MPHATKIFTQAGFQVLLDPVDLVFSATGKNYSTNYFPSAAGLFKTYAALRVLYGRLFVAKKLKIPSFTKYHVDRLPFAGEKKFFL